MGLAGIRMDAVDRGEFLSGNIENVKGGFPS
jgi:hypothetical protein